MPLRGIDGQSNIITCRATAKIQQVDAVRLTWVDTNNRKETIFKPLDWDILHVTLKPCRFPFLILKHKFY